MTWIWLWGALALAGDPPVDAGLSVQTEGAIELRTEVQAEKGELTPFSKLRVGDTLTLPPGASLEIVYFTTGRRESWTGPVELTIAEAAAKASTGQAPQVLQTDPVLGRQLQELPSVIRRGARGPVRSGGDGVDPRSLLDQEELAAVQAATTRYNALCKAFPPRDVLPDICYATVLRTYGLDAEADAVLKQARGRCPFCDLPPMSTEQ